MKAKLLKNPVRTAIKRMFKRGDVPGLDLRAKMDEPSILALLNQAMAAKVQKDLLLGKEQEALQRRPLSFSTFLYDRMLLEHGRLPAAAGQLVQLGNGLAALEEEQPYARLVFRTMGMTTPPYRPDEIQVVLKAHQFFLLCQGIWLNRMRRTPGSVLPSESALSNLADGGSCSIFEVLDELRLAFQQAPFVCDRLLRSLRPDCLAPGAQDGTAAGRDQQQQ